jgi:hypothetical protein
MPRSLDRRIEELSDERDVGNGWFVYLKPGFAYADANTDNPQHSFGEDTMGDVRRSMKMVKPCQCAECVRLLAEAST